MLFPLRQTSHLLLLRRHLIADLSFASMKIIAYFRHAVRIVAVEDAERSLGDAVSVWHHMGVRTAAVV